MIGNFIYLINFGAHAMEKIQYQKPKNTKQTTLFATHDEYIPGLFMVCNVGGPIEFKKRR